MKLTIPNKALFILLLCTGTFCPGEEPVIKNGDFARGLDSWNPTWKSEPFFEVKNDAKAFLRYSREKDQSPEISARLKQDIELEPGFYELYVDYKTDNALEPSIWMSLIGGEKDAKIIRMIRLSNSPERKVFHSRVFVGKNQNHVTLELAPGTRNGSLIKGRKSPNSVLPGQADFYSIRLEKSSFEEPEIPAVQKNFRTEKVIYKTVGTLELALYLDLPEQPAKNKLPVAFWVHGGGWVTGSPEDMLWRAAPLASTGVANARVQYRLIKDGGNFPDTFQDLLDAVQWLRDHAEEYNLDMNRLVIGGGSAGGQLSSILAQKTPECIGYIGMCGMYNLVELGDSRFGEGGKFLLDRKYPQLIKDASAFYNIRKNPPAALLIAGDADATIDYMQSIRFAEEIRKHGGQAEALILEGGGHDFGYAYTVNVAINRFLAGLGFPVKP